jgi:hypothetical protein
VETSNVELSELSVHDCLAGVHLDSTRESARNVALRRSVVANIGVRRMSSAWSASHGVAVQNVHDPQGTVAIDDNLFVDVANHALFLHACCSDDAFKVTTIT